MTLLLTKLRVKTSMLYRLLCGIISLFIENFSVVLINIDIYNKYCDENHPKHVSMWAKFNVRFFGIGKFRASFDNLRSFAKTKDTEDGYSFSLFVNWINILYQQITYWPFSWWEILPIPILLGISIKSGMPTAIDCGKFPTANETTMCIVGEHTLFWGQLLVHGIFSFPFE